MFREIRRKDRILDNELAIRLLEEAEYGFLAMSGINGYGYGIPINYVKEGILFISIALRKGISWNVYEKPESEFHGSWRYTIVPGNSRQVTRALSLFGEMHFGFCRKKSVGMPCGYS